MFAMRANVCVNAISELTTCTHAARRCCFVRGVWGISRCAEGDAGRFRRGTRRLEILGRLVADALWAFRTTCNDDVRYMFAFMGAREDHSCVLFIILDARCDVWRYSRVSLGKSNTLTAM